MHYTFINLKKIPILFLRIIYTLVSNVVKRCKWFDIEFSCFTMKMKIPKFYFSTPRTWAWCISLHGSGCGAQRSKQTPNGVHFQNGSNYTCKHRCCSFDFRKTFISTLPNKIEGKAVFLPFLSLLCFSACTKREFWTRAICIVFPGSHVLKNTQLAVMTQDPVENLYEMPQN